MKHFLIQVSEKDGQVLHDFAFRLLDALRYAEWRHPEPVYSKSFSVAGETIKSLLSEGVSPADIIPIGSLEFVMSRMSDMGINGVEKIKPLNVPPILNQLEYLGRHYESGVTRERLLAGDRSFPLFIKSADRYKGLADILDSVEQVRGLSPFEQYEVSEVVDIQAEWRVFFHLDEVVGMKSYASNDFFPKAPNARFLYRMKKAITEARQEDFSFPKSYTLDVGVSLDGSFLIECHPFVSCGLYGFDNLERLPSMLVQGYQYFIEQAKR